MGSRDLLRLLKIPKVQQQSSVSAGRCFSWQLLLELVLLFADPVSHEQKLSESLDTALNSALSAMPSFTAKLMKSQQQAPGEGGCSSSWGAGTMLGKQRAPQLSPGSERGQLGLG